jgi:hypothetical protein
MTAKFEFTRRLRHVSDRDVDRMREHFLEPARAFDAATLEESLLFPLEMTWFYGEPVYEALPPERKRQLNHLSFCQSYLSTAVAEAATNVLNYEASLATFIQGDLDVAEYMAREVVEETMHIQSFLIIIRKVVAHYGLTIEQLRATNVSLRMASHYARAHTLVGWLRGDLSFYYFTRFALNVNQKTVERCAINEPHMHPVVRDVLKQHAIDEARHMQMSRETGLQALRAMRTQVQRDVAGLLYAYFAARIYIGRHGLDSALPRATRVGTLVLCGVPRREAEGAYVAWRDRVHQPQDPPLVRAGRLYYLRQNHAYIDEMAVSPRARKRMKRMIEKGYADVAGGEAACGVRALELEELNGEG